MKTTLSNLLGPRPTPPLPTHTITIRDHPEPHIMQWSDLELAAIKKYAEQYALQDRAQVQGELEPYDAGLLNDFGGGNVEWWQDYIRAELGRAHDFYQSQITTQPTQATKAEVTDEREAFESCALMEGSLFKRRADDPDKYWDGNVQDDWELWQARAILALRTATQPCGHPASLVIRSAESGEVLYCEACDDKSGRRDAEMREAELLEANQKLRDEILALRPAAVPMTEDQVWHNDALMSANGIAGFKMDALLRIVRAAEAHHGISAQAKKEKP